MGFVGGLSKIFSAYLITTMVLILISIIFVVVSFLADPPILLLQSLGAGIFVAAAVNAVYGFQLKPFLRSEVFEKHGIVSTAKGRVLSEQQIADFLKKARRRIDIVGITAYTPMHNSIVEEEIRAATHRKVRVSIVVANPDSAETILQDQLEEKGGQHQNRALAVYEKYSKIENVVVVKSRSFPKFGIIRWDGQMIVYQYGLKNFEIAPMWAIESKLDGHFDYFESYVEQLIENPA